MTDEPVQKCPTCGNSITGQPFDKTQPPLPTAADTLGTPRYQFTCNGPHGTSTEPKTWYSYELGPDWTK